MISPIKERVRHAKRSEEVVMERKTAFGRWREVGEISGDGGRMDHVTFL